MKHYEVALSRRYKTSIKRLSRHKDFDRELLEEVVQTLARGEALLPKFRDHKLKGTYSGCRECHITSDILLVYQRQDNVLVLVLVDIGSHSTLFK
jgi:mRNA interferase YafQ